MSVEVNRATEQITYTAFFLYLLYKMRIRRLLFRARLFIQNTRNLIKHILRVGIERACLLFTTSKFSTSLAKRHRKCAKYYERQASMWMYARKDRWFRFAQREVCNKNFGPANGSILDKFVSVRVVEKAFIKSSWKLSEWRSPERTNKFLARGKRMTIFCKSDSFNLKKYRGNCFTTQRGGRPRPAKLQRKLLCWVGGSPFTTKKLLLLRNRKALKG